MLVCFLDPRVKQRFLENLQYTAKSWNLLKVLRNLERYNHIGICKGISGCKCKTRAFGLETDYSNLVSKRKSFYLFGLRNDHETQNQKGV